MRPEDAFLDRISNDFLWRERELRQLDRALLKPKADAITRKSGVLIVYSHWEGHFKECANTLLSFLEVGIKRKLFEWTDIRPEVRQRLLFCSYRKSSAAGQRLETFLSHLNALSEPRYAKILEAHDAIIMVDDNLNAMRAEAICRNLGVSPKWFALKKIIIDERLLEHRNAIAHGSRRLRSGDEIDIDAPEIESAISETRDLIRETKNQFSNAIILRSFLA